MKNELCATFSYQNLHIQTNYAGCLIAWCSISSHSYIYIYLHLRYSLDWICSFTPTVRVR